jgi:hypothetical protein
MTSALDTAWLDERITKTKALIVAYEDAIAALSTGAQTYTLDTGQTRQSVTRAQLGSLRETLAELEVRLSGLDARLNGAGAYARPNW